MIFVNVSNMVAKISLSQKPTYFQNIDYSNSQINLSAKNYVTYGPELGLMHRQRKLCLDKQKEGLFQFRL